MRNSKSLISALSLLGLLTIATLASANDDPRIKLFSESGGFDIRTGAHWMRDNVRIERGELVVLADEGRSFTDTEGQLVRVELNGSPTTWRDVLDDGSEVRGRSDELVYDFITETIIMIGNALIENAQGAFSGSKITYDLRSESLLGDGGVQMIVEPASDRTRPRQTPP